MSNSEFPNIVNDHWMSQDGHVIPTQDFNLPAKSVKEQIGRAVAQMLADEEQAFLTFSIDAHTCLEVSRKIDEPDVLTIRRLER